MSVKRRTAVTVAAAATGGVVGLAVWLAQPSYDDHVNACAAALEERAKGDTSKPEACAKVTEDDYTALEVHQAIKDLPEKDRRMFDYFDNGTIDGSI